MRPTEASQLLRAAARAVRAAADALDGVGPPPQLLRAAARAVRTAADALDGLDPQRPRDEADEAGEEEPPNTRADKTSALEAVDRVLERLFGPAERERAKRFAAIPCGAPRGGAPDPCLKPFGIRCPRCEPAPVTRVSIEEYILQIKHTDGTIDLNTAGPDELRRLPFMGPVKIKKILAARPFSCAEDLSRAGWGRVMIERYRPLFTFSGSNVARIEDRRHGSGGD